MSLAAKMDCYGCGACSDVCPQGCLIMEPDEEGFNYPQIDPSKCVNCGLCEKVCPVLQGVKTVGKEPDAWAMQATDEELRLKSSSGGVFSLLAEETLANEGAVFGAAMDQNCLGVKHIMVRDSRELEALRGSKYLQSDMDGCFHQAQDELNRGRSVLFSGTPCQIDGLKSFLGRDYEKLLCVEVICHGVPSPALWKIYVDYQGQRSGATITKVNFRHKKTSWTVFGLRLENSKRRVLYSTLRKDPYLQMFLRNYCLRPSCYQCVAKGLDRSADMTIGDFWGIENVAPEFFDNKGTSLVLVHTSKGEKALADILNKVKSKKVDCTEALKENPAMLCSVNRPPERDTFFSDMKVMSFKKLQKMYIKKPKFRAILIGLLGIAPKLYKKLRRNQ